MKLLVTGAAGQVGWELARSLVPLGTVVALDRERCNLAQPQRLAAVVREVEPAVIVNAAAYTDVDRAEREEELAFAVNGEAVGVLAECARRTGAVLLHYSTDYVFDGRKDSPYTEDDTPCPLNAYGRSKLAGETAVRQVGCAYVVLRTSWIYCARRHNFLRTILRLAGERDELRVVADQIGAPTWARHVADATARIVEAVTREREEDRFASGLYNMTASGAASWHAFAQTILEAAKRDGLCGTARGPRLCAIRSEDYPSPAIRPKNSRLANDRLRARYAIALPDWKRGLDLCLADLGQPAQP
jgi:dTDP-4-dehydrorhamnose reductase